MHKNVILAAFDIGGLLVVGYLPHMTYMPGKSADELPAGELLRLLYDELRALAAAKLAKEQPGQTLQATALVHEAWLRLGGEERGRWANRAQFFGAAAEAMRRILIDNARRKRAVRHGGGLERLDLEAVELAAGLADQDLLAIDEALDRLQAVDQLKAQLVKLHFFAGLTFEECAEALGLSVPTAKRYWTFARAWLYRELKPQ